MSNNPLALYSVLDKVAIAKIEFIQRINKMRSIIFRRMDYNVVGVLRGQDSGIYPTQLGPTPPPPPQLASGLASYFTETIHRFTFFVSHSLFILLAMYNSLALHPYAVGYLDDKLDGINL